MPISRKSPLTTPRFLLIGIDGLFNYGGEAIVRGTVRMLRERWPESPITYASRCPQNDAAILADLPFITVMASTQRWTFKRVAFGLARRIGIGQGTPVRLRKQMVNDFDVILSIGGDNYGFMNEAHKVHYNTWDLLALGEYSMKQGKIFVVWGASIGPFSGEPSIEKRFAEHFKKVSLITARDQLTVDYLASLGCSDNVTLVADPAFMMEPDCADDAGQNNAEKMIIGINFSPASLAHVFGDDASVFEKYKQLLADCCIELLKNSNVHLCFIPHVVPDNEDINNDHVFLSRLHAILTKYHNRITLIPPDLGGPKTKAVVAGCHIIIAARMHCCVAALSSGVPTVLIQYSQKAFGMAGYIYGNDKWCIHLNRLTADKLNSLVNSLLLEYSTLENHLKASKKNWERDSRRGIEVLWGIVNGSSEK